MRITFLLPFDYLTGSMKAAFEFANQLAARGHMVTLVTPTRRSLGGFLHAIRRTDSRRSVHWFDLSVPLIRIPSLIPALLPKADVTVAHDWTTARVLARAGRRRGAQIFLIHGYDVFNAPEEVVHAAWRLPMKKIVVSSWLLQIAQQLDVHAWGPLVYGVDQWQFYNTPRARRDTLRVGMLYHPLPNKGFADGLRAFTLARQEYPSVQLVLFGGPRPAQVEGDAEFHEWPIGERLYQIYASCDVWLVPSWTEGCHMVAMEALACGCALVTTDVGGIRDFAVPGEGALVSPPKAPEALAANLVRVLRDATLRADLARVGRQGIHDFTWLRATAQLEQYLIRAREGKE